MTDKTDPSDNLPTPSPDQLIELARRSFHLASEAVTPEAVARFAEIGRQYIKMAHDEAAIQSQPFRRRA